MSKMGCTRKSAVRMGPSFKKGRGGEIQTDVDYPVWRHYTEKSEQSPPHQGAKERARRLAAK